MNHHAALAAARSNVPDVEQVARELVTSRGYAWDALGDTAHDHWMDEARRLLALPTIRAAFEHHLNPAIPAPRKDQ